MMLAVLLAAQLAFPGADGRGALTAGARGCEGTPQIITVHNAAEFVAAMNADGPRYVNFNTTGPIVVNPSFTPHSCLTLSGATAPGDGVTIANGAMILRAGTHQVIVRHLRIRPGLWLNRRGVNRGCNAWDWRFADGSLCTHPWVDGCEPRDLGAFNGCTACAALDRNKWSNRAPDDWSGCRNVVTNNAAALDGVTIGDHVSDVILNHLSITWTGDEAVDVASKRNAQRITISDSIIGFGITCTDPLMPCPTRAVNPNRGIFLGGIYATPEEAATVGPISFHRNAIGGNLKRVAALQTVGVTEWAFNVVWDNHGESAEFSPYAGRSNVVTADYVGNTFRIGPDDLGRLRQGYCEGGDEAGRACQADRECRSGAKGRCEITHPYFLSFAPVGPGRVSLYLAGNRFLDVDGTPFELERPELDGQWDFLMAGIGGPYSKLRPLRRDAAAPDSAWKTRRLAPLDPPPVPAAPASAEVVLEAVGASLPVRDAPDREIVATWDAPAPWVLDWPTYPKPERARWPDTDADGLSDDWEIATAGDLSLEPLSDPDRDGYPTIEEWMNGTDPLRP